MQTPFPKRQISDSSKLKECAGDNFKFDKYGRKFSKRVENSVGKEKLLVTSIFSFSHSVFKRLLLQTHKNLGLFEKGLTEFLLVLFNPLSYNLRVLTIQRIKCF